MAGKMLLVNPKRRRRAATKRKPATTRRRRRTTRAAAPRTARTVRRRTRTAPARRRRNPSRRGGGRVMARFVQPALTGGGTAVGLDILFGYLPLPAAFSVGYARHATKAAAAIALGMFGSNLGIVRRATAEEMARGALTVYTADIIREGVGQFLPAVPMGYYSPAYVPPSGVNEYMSEYMSGGSARNPLGYESGPTYSHGMSEYVDPVQDTSYIY